MSDEIDAAMEKLRDLVVPGVVLVLDPEEADTCGAFVEDALSEEDALASTVDLSELSAGRSS
jgi:hypothetical protein